MLRVLTTTVLLLSLALGSGPALAEAPPDLTLTGPATATYGASVTLTIALADPAGEPSSGIPVQLQRQDGTTWVVVAAGSTDDNGALAVAVPVPRGSAPRTYRARTRDAGATSAPWTVTGLRVPTTLTLHLPAAVVDGQTVPLVLSWRSALGAVPGTVRILQRVTGGPWRTYAVRTLGPDGTATLDVGPRQDTAWKAVGAPGPWWQAATSAVHDLTDRPPGQPVSYPASAPRPESLPPQPHAVGSGPNARVLRISDTVWRSMVGRSWHPGCPVGRAQLRLVRVNYWDFAGFRRRGEMVLRATIARRAAGALSDMYRGRFPLRAMYRVDRFGWSRRSHGGNDFAAMRHDDSSGFNCRWVTGSPGRTSPHSYGTAIDLNTWENPYWSAVGPLPDRWWATRSDPRVAWRSATHPVVRIWRRHGFRWTYATGDSQHMDARRTTSASDGLLAGGFVAE